MGVCEQRRSDLLSERLNLQRPLVVFDVETDCHGEPEVSRIVELAFQVFYPASEGKPTKEWSALVNPERPIQPVATATHGITDEVVKDAFKFKDIASNIASGFSDVDFSGYNVNFDLRVMAAEMARVGCQWSFVGARIVDPFQLWQSKQPRTLTGAVAEFCHREPTKAHRAMGDVMDTIDVLMGQMERWHDLPRTVEELHTLCKGDRVDVAGKLRWKTDPSTKTQYACFAFGKYVGASLQRISKHDRNYIGWLLKQNGFPPDTRKYLTDALNGVFPQP